MDDFSKYKGMNDNGATPANVYHEAKKDGLDKVVSIRMLREIFQLSLAQAKEIIVKVNTDLSLSDHQKRLTPGLKKALDDLEQDITNGT